MLHDIVKLEKQDKEMAHEGCSASTIDFVLLLLPMKMAAILWKSVQSKGVKKMGETFKEMA